jgi:hypothetical protein
MIQVAHDFTKFHSFPSSLKLVSDEQAVAIHQIKKIPVLAGSKILLKVNVKQENIVNNADIFSRISSRVLVDQQEQWLTQFFHFPAGTWDWTEFTSAPVTIPVGGTMLSSFSIVGGSSLNSGVLGTTWFDDLKIYQDDILIYSDDFNNWNPYIGAGVGALAGIPAYILTKKSERKKRAMIVVGASVVGAVIGGAAGFLTAKP